MTVPTTKDVALHYAKDFGWAVFPLRPRDKRPLSLHGFYDATVDAAQIERWWEEAPHAGLAVATGQASRLVVLDVDPRNGGNESLEAIRAQYGPLPETPEVITGGGGKHYYFSLPPNEYLPSAKPWAGIDIKSEGGYVCACPTVHPSGQRYLWRERRHPDAVNLAPAPDWLISLLRDRMTRMVTEAKTGTEPAPSEYGEGRRNDALASLAGTMQRRGMSLDAIVAALLAENEAKCRPPLPPAEVTAVARSVARYAPDSESVPDPAARPRGLTTMSVAGAVSEDPPPIAWLIDGWLARGDIALLAGEPGAGKSWLTLDLAVSGALGDPIWGRFSCDEYLKVLVVDEENPQDEVIRRLWCVGKAHYVLESGLVPRLDDNLVVTTPRQGFSFRRPESVAWLRQQIEQFRPDLLIFDSITALSTITEEKDAVSVRRFFHDHLAPLQSICGTTILLVHHTNKAVYQKEQAVSAGGMVRGSIDFLAAPDTTFLLERQDGRLSLTNLKPRRMKTPTALAVEIQDVVDEEGYRTGGVCPKVLGEVEGHLEGSREDLDAVGEAALLALQGGPMRGPELKTEICRLFGRQLSRGALDWGLTVLRRSGRITVEPIPDNHKIKLYKLPG